MSLSCFEAFTAAKDPDVPASNEDQIVVVPGIAYAVLDGSTDISGLRFDDELGRHATGGCLAARAMARALRNFAAAPLDRLPEPWALAAILGEAVTALYRRLGRLEAAAGSPENRFRATLAAALVCGDTVRLIRIGDSGLRINGAPVLAHQFPGDVVLGRARAEAWRLLAGRGADHENVRATVRNLIVAGLDPAAPDPALGFTGGDLEEIMARTLAHKDVEAAVAGRPELGRRILEAGLRGIRAAPDQFDALVIDGIGDVSSAAAIRDLPLAGVETLEIFSDGYPALPETASIAAWEAALAMADSADPERVGAFASTKGRIGRKFADDRSILIVRHGASHPS